MEQQPVLFVSHCILNTALYRGNELYIPACLRYNGREIIGI